MQQINYPAFYRLLQERVNSARAFFRRPMTLAEKLLAAHCVNLLTQDWRRGESMLRLRPDWVALQDATAQMALLQFMQPGPERTLIPTTIHCDHLIQAQTGAEIDLRNALGVNQEVYNFLSSAARRYGIGFWPPGSGIIHQVVLENHAFPGGLLIGTDSHTPNAGGLGMLAVGVGGADAAEVMLGMPLELLDPKLIGVRLTGKLSGWVAAKDVITYLCTKLTVSGGTNKIIEYFGPGVESISATGRATICNMGAELGATTSIFHYDYRTGDYLLATNRGRIRDEFTDEIPDDLLRADREVFDDPSRFFDEVVEINLDELQPYVVGPHSPDRGRQILELHRDTVNEGWPEQISACLIGSCTNSSYEDLCRAANVLRQGLRAGLKLRTPLFVTPGSAAIYELMRSDGLLETFTMAGATVLANACGPCIGNWKRTDVQAGTPNVIVSSFNRNFPGRNDGSKQTLSFITSPELVAAMAFAGTLLFNPVTGGLLNGDETFQFQPPYTLDLPIGRNFPKETGGFELPAGPDGTVQIVVPRESFRLQLLEPFPAWDGQDLLNLPVLLKTRGKTTTDHISPAGHWLQFRGHLDRISDNMFATATNAFTATPGTVRHPLTGKIALTAAEAARDLKAKGIRWVVIGDHNHGEGSSREHAAMSPRYLGCAAVIARSFARIHEANLKKQGVLALTFVDPDDYDKVRSDDLISIRVNLAPGAEMQVALTHSDRTEEYFFVRHSFVGEQVEWFKAGSAFNAVLAG